MNKHLITQTFRSMFLILMVAAVTLGGSTGCKSKKKLAREQAAAEYAARVDQAKKDLNAILNDETSWTLKEKEQRVKTIKNWNLNDKEVLDLLDRVEDKLARERAEAERKAEEERLRREEEARLKAETSKHGNLEGMLRSVAASPDFATANDRISQTLQLFATPDVPVLVIISQAGGFNDYDRPTTIRKYLDYLKDQKTFNNRIEQVKYDSNGKITELELIKR
jgi:ketosteroid isomerase-like protein